MTRTVNGERLFDDRAKEVLRKMIWQVSDFCGVEVLTYCVMSNHFHVLVRVPVGSEVSDAELMRRYLVLYPKPNRYQVASIGSLRADLAAGGESAKRVREQLLARMGDISEFMKTLKQRFTVWFNKSHRRFGTLWADRFKSVLVEGAGNPLQTMAAYIDLNPVRAGLVNDPKDYRFCGYAEAVAGHVPAGQGLLRVWCDRLELPLSIERALQVHRLLLFGKGGAACGPGVVSMDRAAAVQVLEREDGVLPRSMVLRCRVRYFTDGVILGSEEFVRGLAGSVPRGRRPLQVNGLKGAAWGDLSVLRSLRRQVFF
jgi:REP element-mobilizing transposase RayT